MSLLERTNQMWKLYVFGVAMALGAVVTMCQPFLHDRLDSDVTTSLAIGGALLVIGGIAWAATFITCPNCKHRLFWHAVIDEGLGRWFTWLTTQEECPKCGSRDGVSAPRKKRGRAKG